MKMQYCACGEPLPVHLAELVDDDERFEHVCSCESSYVVKDGKFVRNGEQVNPFARARG